MELERDIPDLSAVRYLRAAFYVSQMHESEAERPAFYQKAIGALRTLAAQGNGHYHRKALATLASLYFSERDYANASDHFRQYLTVYPTTEWAWIAALRVGQSEQALGEWKRAAGAYAAAAATYSSVPMARVLGRVYAAGAYDALSQFERARVAYEAALAGWDKDYGLVSRCPRAILSGLVNNSHLRTTQASRSRTSSTELRRCDSHLELREACSSSEVAGSSRTEGTRRPEHRSGASSNSTLIRGRSGRPLPAQQGETRCGAGTRGDRHPPARRACRARRARCRHARPLRLRCLRCQGSQGLDPMEASPDTGGRIDHAERSDGTLRSPEPSA